MQTYIKIEEGHLVITEERVIGGGMVIGDGGIRHLEDRTYGIIVNRYKINTKTGLFELT